MANLVTNLDKDFDESLTAIATRERNIVKASVKSPIDTFGGHKPKVFSTNQTFKLGEYEISKHVAHHLRTIENNIERFHDIYTIDWR